MRTNWRKVDAEELQPFPPISIKAAQRDSTEPDGRERGNENPMDDTMSALVDQRKSSPFAESKYLLFYPHAGYTNQIIALGNAAELA